MNVIEVRNLNVWYGKFQALDDVSFVVSKGKIAGLIGPNGAGKTTIIKSILGLISYEGSIKFGSESVSNKNIGYVSENEGYYEWLTAREYLKFYLELYGEKDEDRVNFILNKIGLYDRADMVIKNFSNGMKRRLGIARALIHDPDIVVMDEPLSGVDPKIKREIKDMILDFAEESKTFLISSHQLSDIESICDWLIMINEGKILSYGAPEEIIKKISPLREVVIHVEDMAKLSVDDLRAVHGVEDVIVRNNNLTILYHGDDDSVIFKYFVDNKIKFTLKSDTLSSLYRGAYK